jgi:hypothetical protein
MIVFHLLGLLKAERIFRSRPLNENSLICSFILGVKIFMLNVSLLSLHPGRISMQAALIELRARISRTFCILCKLSDRGVQKERHPAAP